MTRAPARPALQVWGLPALLLVAFFLRLLFVGNEGFKTDINTYAAWALTLSEHGFRTFYSTAGFADYPPGYFYILGIVGRVWHAFFASHDAGYAILHVLVKLPAILADLGVGLLLFALVRRFAGAGTAFGVAAFYLFNPATIYISASWGQVDSISGGLALLAIYALLRSERCGPTIALAPGLDRLRLALVWVFDSDQTAGSGLAAAAGCLCFRGFQPPSRADRCNGDRHRRSPGARPARNRTVSPQQSGRGAGLAVPAVRLWLERLSVQYGKRLQPVGATRHDVGARQPIYLGAPAISLGLAARRRRDRIGRLALRPEPHLDGLARSLRDRHLSLLHPGDADARTLSFQRLALYDRVHSVCTTLPWGAIALSIVLFANLVYSLQYLHAVTGSVPGVNAQNLWGLWTTLFSLLAVGTFFVLGYQFLGGAEVRPAKPSPSREPAPQAGAAVLPAVRHWFDPREGLTAMRAPLDYAIVAVLGLGNFILSFIGYWWPPDKIFDEIYFARAGEEYLQNMRIYENTHPPLTKLMITLSIMLFGGMPHGHGLGGWPGLNLLVGHLPNGDNSYGWRFLDVVFGALVVMLLYVFAKRVTGSTVFATITALLLTFDGMHFVQSRIATPEGFVVFFATLAVYAFYRFWINSQVGERAHVAVPTWGLVAGAGGALFAGRGSRRDRSRAVAFRYGLDGRGVALLRQRNLSFRPLRVVRAILW